MNEVLAQAASEGAKAAPEAGGFDPSLILFIVGWGAILYFFFIKPQKKKDKVRKSLLDNLKKKDEIITVGGIMGKVDSIMDEVVSVKVADNVVMKFQRSAISRIVSKDAGQEDSNSCALGCSK